MDRKSIIVIVVCFVLLVLWQSVLVPKLYPPPKAAPGSTNTMAATSGTITTNTPGAAPAPVAAPAPGTTATATAPSPAPRLAVNTNEEEVLEVVSSPDARYTFTSYGGGLKEVELIHYPETVPSRRDKKSNATNRLATLNADATVPTLAILGGDAVQGDGIFTLTRTATGVRAEKTLGNGLTVIKEFSLGTNYLVAATVRLENRSTNTLSLPAQEWVVGTATPMSQKDDGTTVGLWWHNGSSSKEINSSYFANLTLGCFPGTPRPEYRGEQTNIVWAAVNNQFFTLVLMPQTPAVDVVARKVNLPPPSAEELRQDPRAITKPAGYETALIYPALTLTTGQAIQREFHLFAGPKEYRTLAVISGRFNNKADLVMGFGGFFGFFSKALLLGMNWLHDKLILPYGWAIIAITIIIKTLFWPLTQASTRSMKRMQSLQPQMKAIAEKYKDDPAKRNQKTMEFMKQNKVNPMGGCLPMLLQMPVFIGFFYMIRSAIELRGASFLWVNDLSQPDTLFLIPGLNFPVNPLPLLMGVTMLWQSHLTPASPGMDPMQQKMMRYMPLMFLVMLYNFSAGLTLYWTVQNLLTIAQMKLTKTEPVAAPAATALTPPQKKRK
jgi:YidC/Oxa1 family membrane protein insertase